MSLLSDGEDIIDKEYKDFTAEMYANGHSFFTYISDSPDALASCCRLRNEITKNEFSFTSGLTGVATGSVNVITLNINRILQDYYNEMAESESVVGNFESYLRAILDRVHKYHIAYKSLLVDLFNHNMLPVYTNGYINLNQQFSTIGINGMNEAAMYLGIDCSDNEDYLAFTSDIISIIAESNKEASNKNIRFNLEYVPAESLGMKNYSWDKEDGYIVPEGRNCYTSYMFLPDDESIDVLERFRMHGKAFTDQLSGGVALHCNLEEHLSKSQYLKLIDYAIQQGTSYFTFNIPNSECNNCKYITKSPIKKCPHCGSEDITWWTRIIGYLRPISAFSKGRQVEASKRIYSKQ